VGIGTASPDTDLHIKAGVSGQTPANIAGIYVENAGTANSSFVFQTATAGGGKSFSITNAGNVGIGTTTPAELFHVGGRATADSWAVGQIANDNVNNAPWYGIGRSNITIPGQPASTVQVAGYYGLTFKTAAGQMTLNTSGDLSLDTGNLSLDSATGDLVMGGSQNSIRWGSNSIVGGNSSSGIYINTAAGYLWLNSLTTGPVYSLRESGSYGMLTNTNPSSRDYKSNILPVNLNASRLLQLQPKSFVWKANGKSDFGYIAEDVRQILPELWRDDGTTKGYAVDKLPVYTIELVKQQQTQIDQLRKIVCADHPKANGCQ
jgi:hypothetical protein